MTGLIEDHHWVRSIPTLTDAQECALCGEPRADHEIDFDTMGVNND